jgi:purine nucleosidase
MTSLDELPLVKEIYPEGTPVHDLLVSVFLVDSSIFTHKMVNVEVEVDSELTLGQTVVDSLGISGRKQNVNWVYDLDSDEVYNVLFDSANKLN